MNINSTVISGYQVLNDMRYLLDGIITALVITDNNIEAILAVQALIGQLRQQIAALSMVNSVPMAVTADDVRAVYLTLFPSHQA